LVTKGEKRKVLNIDTKRECAATSRAHLIKRRHYHSSVYHDYLRVVGGDARPCERYVCGQDHWELFGTLSGKYRDVQPVAMEAPQSIYGIGGFKLRARQGLIWRLDVISLTIEALDVKLPRAVSDNPCFMLSLVATEVYMLLDKDLYSFSSTSQVSLIRRVRSKAQCKRRCYYRGGTLHFSDAYKANTLAIGDLR
jgi:hypothetical protein